MNLEDLGNFKIEQRFGESFRFLTKENMFDDKAWDLIKNMLRLNPDKRIFCTDILDHSYFD